MLRKLLITASLAAITLTGISNAQDAEDPNRLSLEGVAAVVNDKPISYSDVRERARMLLLSLGGQQPTPEQVQQITGQALEQLIDERLQIQKAEEFEVEVDEQSIAASVSDMARQSGMDGDALKLQLLNSGVNPASLEDQMRADIAWSNVMSGLYGSRIRISDNQVEDQLTRMRTAAQKTQYRVAEIFLYAPDPATQDQALQAATSILEQLREGADFNLAAQQISSAPTAATGGDIGWVSTEDVSPEIAAAISSLPGPGLTEPVITDTGIYLLLVSSRREPAEPTTKVDLNRLFTMSGSEENLKKAIETIESCDDVSTVANSDSDLRSTELTEIAVDSLGEEGKSLVLATDIGAPTDIFAISGGLAVMYVCARDDGAEALPSSEDIKNNLKSRELGMISERELRDLRREATIIYR